MLTIDAQEEEYEVPHKPGSKRVQIRIQDTGPLIHYDEIDHVFDPVFEPRGYRFSDGLGLHRARQLIEQYHGTIYVKNTFRSAAFRIAIPIE